MTCENRDSIRGGWIAAALVFVLAIISAKVLAQEAGSAAAAAPATAAAPGVFTADADPMFSQPFIDVDEWRDQPVRHRYVHGGFKGTDMRFSFYFPTKEGYQGRFFQYVTPVPDSEYSSQEIHGAENPTAFSISSGAYFVETNGGGVAVTAGPAFNADPTISAFRANAAAARYSRTVAMEMYGSKRPYGYIFGGSGGAFRTLGSMENTSGVWDGAVPFVMVTPASIPSLLAVRMNAMRILWDKFPQIVDALEPGGSGDPYAGLNEEQRGALREATRFGFPPQSWYAWKTMGVHAFTAVYPGIVAADPTYFTDFWTKPGYLGFEPPASLKRARMQFRTAVKAAVSAEEAEAKGISIARAAGTARGSADLGWEALVGKGYARPIAFELTGPPPAKEVNFIGGDLLILSGAAKGKALPVREIVGNVAVLGVVDPKVLAQLKPGDEVQVDNSNFLAAQTYQRHQDPGSQYAVWDQYRTADGKPVYPQRPRLLGPIFAMGAAGTIPTGSFSGKVILIQALWDREAFAWKADWYRQRVKEHFGANADDHFRLWYLDHALHGAPDDLNRTVSYVPMVQQALKDVAAWTEKGVAPPITTSYRVVDGQVVVPRSAAERLGIQPVVTLKVNGGVRAEVKTGELVTFSGSIEVPPDTGYVVEAQWDFDGTGSFAESSSVPDKERKAAVSITHRFSKPGTYFVALRGASERQGDKATPFARPQNLGRVRVVVR